MYVHDTKAKSIVRFYEVVFQMQVTRIIIHLEILHPHWAFPSEEPLVDTDGKSQGKAIAPHWSLLSTGHSSYNDSSNEDTTASWKKKENELLSKHGNNTKRKPFLLKTLLIPTSIPWKLFKDSNSLR